MLSRFSFLFLAILSLLGCNQYKLADNVSSDLTSFSIKNCLYVRNSAGQIVSWKASVPIQFTITSHVPEQWRDAVRAAAKVWKNTAGTELILIKNEISTSENAGNDKRNLIYWSQ